MSRVITFSRVFPAYHPRRGEPTNFVEQIYNSIFEEDGDWSNAPGDPTEYVAGMDHSISTPKHHTIRSGNRWKVGDKFSPRVWSGKPYDSKMITIAPDIEIKKVWDIEMYITSSTGYTQMYVHGVQESSRHKKLFLDRTVDKVFDYHYCGSVFHRDNTFQPFRKKLAENDGLSVADFADWFLLNPDLDKVKGVFDRYFKGQIICWNDQIEY